MEQSVVIFNLQSPGDGRRPRKHLRKVATGRGYSVMGCEGQGAGAASTEAVRRDCHPQTPQIVTQVSKKGRTTFFFFSVQIRIQASPTIWKQSFPGKPLISPSGTTQRRNYCFVKVTIFLGCLSVRKTGINVGLL